MAHRACCTLLALALLHSSVDGLQLIDLSYEGGVVFGREESVTTFATLATSVNVTSAFTICSSISSVSSATVMSLFQLLGAGGGPWLVVWLERLEAGDQLTLMMDGREGGLTYPNHSLVRRPLGHFWSHGCLSVSTATGRLVLVWDGQVVEDRSFQEVVATEGEVVGDLQGRLVLGKMNRGFWYQCSQRVTNMHIWGRELAVEDMVGVTGVRCGEQEGALAAWPTLEWELHGEAEVAVVHMEEVCEMENKLIVLTTSMSR